MRVLSLFSGGGLGDYGLTLAGMEIVGQVEIDDYCQKILKLRWPDVPKWKDIRDFDGHYFAKEYCRPDVISGGFPCQDISNLNQKGLGLDGAKSGLWREMFRVICEARPRYVIVENGPSLPSRGLGRVLGDLASRGFHAEWDVLPACAFGAPHERSRTWIVAYTDSKRQQTGLRPRDFRAGYPKRQGVESERPSDSDFTAWNPPKPNVGRVAHGVPNRVERLKLLGNGQVVYASKWIGSQVMNLEHFAAESRLEDQP